MRFSTWNHKLRTMFEMITTQATGVPDGNHGLFHRYAFENTVTATVTIKLLIIKFIETAAFVKH